MSQAEGAEAGSHVQDLLQDHGKTGMWPMTDESREKIVDRIATNLAAISFFSSTAPSSEASADARLVPMLLPGHGAAMQGPDGPASSLPRLDDEAAREHALVIEREAFMSADAKFRQAQGSVSPGTNAEAGVVMAYAQHASDAMIALLQAKVVPPSQATPSAGEVAGGAVKSVEVGLELDLAVDGKREFLDHEGAQRLLQPMLAAKPNKHHKVRLSTKSFKPSACAAVAEALQNAADTLRHADLSDIIAGQPEEEALAVLAEITGALQGVPLLSLDLSNNALGEKGLRACAPVLTSQRCLEALYFCNNGISAAAGEAIVELLPKECAGTLKTLHFHNNMTGDDGAEALAELVGPAAEAGLEDFRFSSTRVGSDGGIALAKALGRGSKLRKVDMRDNMLAPEGAEALAETLAKHPSLEELYLGDTSLSNEGVCTILKALAANCSQLKVLDLAGNDLNAEAAPEVAKCLESFPALRRLVLSENELQDEGTTIIAAALPGATRELEELDLGTNEIEDRGAKAATEAACQLPKMRLLNLNGNAISRATVSEIQQMLADGCAGGVEVLGPLDENEDGEDDDEE